MDNSEKKLQPLIKNKEQQLDVSYWNTRWEMSETGWDTGFASPSITDYLSRYHDKKAAILIPGCGNAYEAEYLLLNGFTNITLIDLAPKAVERLHAKFENQEGIRILCEDFFLHQGAYDLIIEQTFFCAIDPGKRINYSNKMASLLNPHGKLVGVLFNRAFTHQGPPFGGDLPEYNSIFEPNFELITMTECYNSVPARMGSEVFIIFQKKQSREFAS
nr:methyltransferase domain-containing protein [uncultured Fluviicola sp.]